MTLTVKDSPDLNSPGKPGAPSRNSENKAGRSPRSNPVCLEVAVTIRSLPGEAGGPAQPMREEGRTVIVFDNGAVLRGSNSLTVGRTLILSNAGGRDVVCRVADGRNLPSVKGYVEVEFLEPVNDFWGIHQDAAAAGIAAPPSAPAAPLGIPAPASPPHAASPNETLAKAPVATFGSSRQFDDVPSTAQSALHATIARDSKPEPPASTLGMSAKPASEYSHAAVADPDAIANWQPAGSDQPANTISISAPRQASADPTHPPVPAHDFMSKGLMAYEQPGLSSSASAGRAPLIVGLAALILAGVCAAVFLTHRKSAPSADGQTAALSQANAPIAAPAASNTPEAASAPQDQAAQSATPPDAQPQASPQLLEVDPLPPAAAPAPSPAAVTSALGKDSSGDLKLETKPDSKADSRADARNARKPAKPVTLSKQSVSTPPSRPAIANLKMSSPSAPNQNPSDAAGGNMSLADVAANESSSVPPAGLLTSAGRTSNPPAAPPSAPAPAPVSAPRVLREPTLISSVRPSYPAAARQSNVQGTVTVSANVDENGRVVSARARSGPLLLREAAADSVKQWKYSPGTVDGRPSPSQVTVGVEFRLN